MPKRNHALIEADPVCVTLQHFEGDILSDARKHVVEKHGTIHDKVFKYPLVVIATHHKPPILQRWVPHNGKRIALYTDEIVVDDNIALITIQDLGITVTKRYYYIVLSVAHNVDIVNAATNCIERTSRRIPYTFATNAEVVVTYE